MDIAWGIVGVVFALLIGVGVSVLGLNPPEYNIARACFWASAIALAATTLIWALRTQQPTWWRVAAGATVWVCIGVGLPETLRWVKARQTPSLETASVPAVVKPVSHAGPPATPKDPVKPAAHPVKTTPVKETNYRVLSNEDLGHEIIRLSASITVVAKRQQVQMDDISEAMERVKSDSPRPSDPKIEDLRTLWFQKSDALTLEVRTRYFPQLSLLRSAALERLAGKVAGDPNEKRLWEAMVSYLDSPPSPVTAVHLEEYARYFTKIGESVESL